MFIFSRFTIYLMIFLHLLWLGLSLKTQVLTAIFLAVRVFCSFIMEGDIHTILDFVTLVATLWVIYMMKFKLKSSYMADLDTMHYWYLVSTFFSSGYLLSWLLLQPKYSFMLFPCAIHTLNIKGDMRSVTLFIIFYIVLFQIWSCLSSFCHWITPEFCDI